MHFKICASSFFLKYRMCPLLWRMCGSGPLLVLSPSWGPTHTSLVPLRFLPVKGPQSFPSACRSPQWARQTTAEVRKKGIYCISAIYTLWTTSEKICTTWFEDMTLRTSSAGHITMATNQTWTGAFHTIWVRPGAALVRSFVVCLLNISP